MRKGFLLGGIGNLIYLIITPIYVFLRHTTYFSLGGLNIFINFDYDNSLHLFYFIIGISIFLMGFGHLEFFNENRIEISRSTFIFSLIIVVFSIFYHPKLINPISIDYRLFDFIVLFASNTLMAFFFLFSAASLIKNREFGKNETIILTNGLFILILSCICELLSIINFIISLDFYFTRAGISNQLFLFMLWTGSTDPHVFPIYTLFYFTTVYGATFPNIATYFLIWFFSLIPLGFLGILTAYNFFKEIVTTGIYNKNKEKIKQELLLELREASNRYSGTTLEALKSKTGYNKSYLSSLIKEMISEGIFQGVIRRNIISFETRYKTPSRLIKKTPIKDFDKVIASEHVGIKAFRGGEIQGRTYIYKIKVENNTKYNITDLIFQIVSYPEDSIELLGEPYDEVSKLDVGGFVSPTFEFVPTRDCIMGTIHSTVTYIDHLNKPHTINVEPFTISLVCGLLRAKEIDINEFTRITEELLDFEKTGEEIKIPYNSKLIFDKLKILLPDYNFWFVTKPEYRILGDMFIGEFNGFAEGKYNKKGVGLKITITGKVDSDFCMGLIEVYAQDNAMLPPLISELSKKIIIWSCKECNAPIDKEAVEKLLRNQPIECKYCGFVITKLLI